MLIGIFDSGRGGRFVTETLRQLLPEHQYILVSDPVHAPYGERPLAEVARLTMRAVHPLTKHCPIIVLACNTATAAAIDELRRAYPRTIFIGFEPMIKPAAGLSKNQHVTLLATTATQQADHTKELVRRYAPGCTIDYPTTVGWAAAIDANQAGQIDLAEVEASIASGSDTIIIGCTHYIALIERLHALWPDVAILEPTSAVARQISRQAEKLPL